MATNFTFKNGGTITDTDNVFIRRDIFTTGGLWTWGQDNYGQLGDGATTTKSIPTQTVSAGTNWKQVASGYSMTSAIKTDGTLWSWGRNNLGQLGDNTIVSKSSPVQTIAGGTNWKQVSCGKFLAAAIKTDGTLWTWGDNSYGNLGDGTMTNKSSPIQTVSGGTNWKIISTGDNGIAAIKTDGTLWSWGRNDIGQMGDNTTLHKSSPVQTISGGTNWKQVSMGTFHISAIKTDGSLWLWGYNNYGQLGNNTITNKSSPIQTVSAGTNWKQVSSGAFTTAAIKTDGTLWSWGRNNLGQLADGTTINKSSPVQTIAGGTNWKMVSICPGFHFASIREDYY
jgi:alpha-tubulin suppressor-like RCC1 family protein